jgi:hypothetical protein
MRLPLALLALLVGLAVGGCGSGDDTAAEPAVTVVVTETETETETAAPEPEVECSTAGLRTTLPEQKLPEPVAKVRERIFRAALACDYDELERIALEKGAGFTFTFGEGVSAAEYWRELEQSRTEQPMRAIVTILSLAYTRNESGSYQWPSAFDESPSEGDWQALVDSGLYTQADIDAMKQQGAYLGWRTAITPDGDWLFFVAGN